MANPYCSKGTNLRKHEARHKAQDSQMKYKGPGSLRHIDMEVSIISALSIHSKTLKRSYPPKNAAERGDHQRSYYNGMRSEVLTDRFVMVRHHDG